MGSVGVALIFLIMFSSGIVMAGMAGHWENKISKKTYFFYMMTQGMMEKPGIGTEQSKTRKMEKMIKMMNKGA